MDFSIASYSFHRLVNAGKQDMFQYITDSKRMGMAALDPWVGHLQPLMQESDKLKNSDQWDVPTFSDESLAYVERVRAAIDEAGLPLNCLAIDGPHIYEPDEETRRKHRASAYRWLDAAHRMGSAQVRIDCGGPKELDDEQFRIIVDGYNDLIARAREKGMNVVIENHWGASQYPPTLRRILDAVDGLGLLFDTNNFAAGSQQEGWRMFVGDAKAVHIKTFEFDENGNDPTVDIPKVIGMLLDAGYSGLWGIESVPRDGDEYGAIEKTRTLVERAAREHQSA
jgi:sugar phosphate isomerase/epimerase